MRAGDKIKNRLDQLYTRRAMLEKALDSIANGMEVPDIAQSYITSQIGQDGQRMHGEQKLAWLKEWLDRTNEEIRKFIPRVVTRRTADAMNVLGKDLSSYRPSC